MIKLKSGNNDMRATKNSIAGEVAFIKRSMHNNYEKIYLKLFNDENFIKKVVRQLKNECKNYEITFKEDKYEYILSIKMRRDK